MAAAPRLDLPPPLPLPPREGMRVYRGRWVSEYDIPKPKKQQNVQKVRPYNYKPFISISGKSKQSTVDRINNDEDGEHSCPYCGVLFARKNSLETHIRRAHNPKRGAECPECGKSLSHQSAIKKHLLSHRPREEWPYMCPLCLTTFQAKGDLPKHLMTRIHANDDIPEPGSPGWKELMNKSVRLPQIQLMKERAQVAKSLVTPTASAGVTSLLAEGDAGYDYDDDGAGEVFPAPLVQLHLPPSPERVANVPPPELQPEIQEGSAATFSAEEEKAIEDALSADLEDL